MRLETKRGICDVNLRPVILLHKEEEIFFKKIVKLIRQ